MTSTNDGKEVKSYQTSGQKSKSYFIELYKSLESRLSEAETASERTKHLCEAWRRVHSLCQHSASTTHPHLLSWLQRHTARAVLQTKWQSPERKDDRRDLEDAINVFIVESNVAAASREGDSHQWEAQLVARGEWFKKILEHPWKHPVLNCLLNPDGTPPTDNEVLEWLKEERGVTFVMRLHTLVSEKCDDIAMSLATAVMERVRGDISAVSDLDQSDDRKEKPEPNASSFGERLKEEAGFTVDVWEMLTDIEFVLLHKRDSPRCITLAKQTPLRSAYQLIERLQSRLETSPRDKRLWKNSKEVAVLIAQVVITRCMMIPVCGGGSRSALYCCARALARLLPRARLAGAAAALAAPAPTAAHLHTLAAAIDAQLHQKNETGMKPFVCELYVRAITAGMNELERLKLKTEKDMEARSMEQTIGSWFVQLGAVLSSSERVKCECALTAFSVHPSPQMYERIKAAPALPPIPIPDVEETSTDANPEFGSWASDSRSQTNFVKTSETLNMKARQNQANVLSTAILTEGETLGLSPELCQDITVLLSGPRVKTLSWDMDRELLLENCRAYLERTHGGTKAVTTELKYLNLNPADFQYLPEEDDDETNIYYGIEKGYEHLVEFQEPEDIWENAYDKADTAYFEKSGTSYSSEEFDFIQPQRRRKTKKPVSKSDENDPLSLVAETKRKEKKERPHSKERSKDKKKAADPMEKKEPGDPLELGPNQEPKKEKPKRERKKKAPKPTEGSLANLVGLKVGISAKPMKIPITDSDADSQGYSSVRSMNSEENVLYDGVFSMDDMRSPRSSHSSDSIGLTYESSMASGQVVNNPKAILNRPYRPVSVSGIRIASPSPSKSLSPADRPRNDSPTHISDDVKGSLAKLIEYRRQKALEDQRRKPKAIIRPDGSMAMDKISISPKGVAIPEIPKSYISKQSDNMTMIKQMDHSLNERMPNTAIPSPVIQYASKQFTSPDKLIQSNYGPRQYNNVQADLMAPSDRCFSTPPSTDKFLDSVNLISIYDKYEPTRSRNPNEKSLSHPDVSEDNQRRSNVDTSYINYQDYVHEFSLNAYNQYTEHKDCSKKVISPISSVSPVVPNKKPEYKTPQSAKQMPQKKPDGSLNTFARMSYYKNKQTDMKKSQDMAQHGQPQTDSKLDEFIMDHLLNSQKSANSQANVQALIRLKTETLQTATTTRDHPMLSNILHGNSSQLQNHKKTTSPPKSGLSEKDHNDLLMLLRQQNALNRPQNLPAASCSKSLLKPTLNLPLAFGSKSIASRTDANYDSNSSLVPPSFMPNRQSGKTNEAVKNVPEGKIINVISTSIIKSADKKQKDTKPKPANSKKSTEDKPKKTKSRGPKKIAPKPEPRKNPEEWENVMNAILKQKTPCRGPNALDMALNKSSFEKAFEDSLRQPPCLFGSPNVDLTQSTIISQTESIHEEFLNITQSSATAFSRQTVTKTQKTTYTPLKIPSRPSLLKKSSKTKKSVKTPLKVTSTVETLIRQQGIEDKTIERLMKNNNIEITKHNSSLTLLQIPERTRKLSNVEKPVKVVEQRHIENSKIDVQQNHVERLKKTVNQNNDEPKKHEKHIVSEIPKKEAKQGNVQLNQLNDAGLKQDDPFITGIPNSDYDLLDELMDDDLRKEIGELSSDEETYHAQDFLKDTKLDQTRAEVVYNHSFTDNASVAPITSTHQPMCKQNEMPQATAHNPTQRPHSREPKIAPARPAQNKPVICLNANNVPNVSTHVMTQSTQARACNSASLLRSTPIPVETNMFIAVPRPEPVQNVMRTPSELNANENYPSVQSSMQAVPNIAPNSYIAGLNASNISVYQPTQFVAPNVTPLIINSAAPIAALITPVVNNVIIAAAQPEPVIKITQTEYCLYSNELHQPFHVATAQGNIIVDGNKLETKTTCVPNAAGTDILPKTEVKTSAGENEGKSSERKVLKEVQEKHADEKIDCKSKQQAAKKSQQATAKDLKTQADQERLEKKRMAILNRKISNFCGIKTIALGYSPLQLSSTLKDYHVANIHYTENGLIQSNENNLQEVSNEINSPATPDSCKENKNEPTHVRRILLRSSNKYKSKISSTSSPQPSLDQKLNKSTAISSNTLSETPSQNEQSDLEINDKQKRVSKRIRNKSVTIPKDTKNNETKLQVEVQKKTTRAPKLSKRNVKNASNKIENPNSNNDFETKKLFDVKSKLVGSTTRKIKPIYLNGPDPSSAISSPACIGEKLVETLISDKTEFVSLPIQEDRLLESLPPNKTTKSSDLEYTYKQTLQPIDIPKINVNVASKTGEINAIVDNSTEDVVNSVLEETRVQEIKTVVTEEKDENINENVKEITLTKLSLQPDMVKTNKVKTLIQVCSPGADLTSELISQGKDQPTTLTNHQPSSTNITKNEIAQKLNKNDDKYDVKQNSAQIQSNDKSNVGQRQKTHENITSNKSCNIVAPRSQVVTGVDGDDDDIEIVGDIPNNPPNPKYIQSNPSPDSIVIENISGAYDDDPLKKRVRIKLGNGKVFKGTVSGSVNVSTMLNDPKIKALLISQFEQSKKLYSLRLNINKDFSRGTQLLSTQVQQKSKPHLPMETVSLLSDEEEDDSPKVFVTEYGKHKIAPMDDGLFKKHQKKFMVKSYVSVKKLSLAEENAIKRYSETIHKDNVTTHTQILKECVILDDSQSSSICSKKLDDTNILAAIPSKYVQGVFDDIDNILAPTNTDSNEEPIVLIDDSSNDSVDIKNKAETKEKIDELKNMLLKDLGVDNFLTSTNEATDDVQVTWDSQAIDLTDDPVLKTTDTLQAIVREDYKKIMNRKCFVKLVRCDDPPQCQPILVKDDEFEEKIDEIIQAPLSRSGSFSILEEFPTVDELNKMAAEIEQSRSSPVMEIYDLIASLERTSTKQNIRNLSEVPLKCYTEWMATKKDENMKSLDVTMKHSAPQTLVVPKLSILILSYIQKEDLVNKISFHTSLTSLKRKTMPSSLPVAKMSKLDNPADEPHPNVSTSTIDLSVFHAPCVTKEIVDEIEASIKPKEVLITEEQQTIGDLDTSDLSDSDVTNITASEYSDNDDIMTLINKDMEFEESREAHTGENMLMNKILNCDKGNAELDNNVTEYQNKSIVGTISINHDLSKNCVADFYDEQLSRKITEETSAEFQIDPVDGIRIELDILKQLEEPDLIQTDLDQASIDENNTLCYTDIETELNNKVTEEQNKLRIDPIDINPDLSKNCKADFPKEYSSKEIPNETKAKLPIVHLEVIPIDLDMQQIEEPVSIKTDLLQAHKEDDKNIINPGIPQDMHEFHNADNPDLGVVGVTGDQVMHESHNADNPDLGVVGVTGDQVMHESQNADNPDLGVVGVTGYQVMHDSQNADNPDLRVVAVTGDQVMHESQNADNSGLGVVGIIGDQVADESQNADNHDLVVAVTGDQVMHESQNADNPDLGVVGVTGAQVMHESQNSDNPDLGVVAATGDQVMHESQNADNPDLGVVGVTGDQVMHKSQNADNPDLGVVGVTGDQVMHESQNADNPDLGVVAVTGDQVMHESQNSDNPDLGVVAVTGDLVMHESQNADNPDLGVVGVTGAQVMHESQNSNNPDLGVVAATGDQVMHESQNADNPDLGVVGVTGDQVMHESQNADNPDLGVVAVTGDPVMHESQNADNPDLGVVAVTGDPVMHESQNADNPDLGVVGVTGDQVMHKSQNADNPDLGVVAVTGDQVMHESQNADNPDQGVVRVAGDQVSGNCQSKTPLLKTRELDEDLDEYSESVTSTCSVTKYIVEKMKETKDLFIPKKQGKVLDVFGLTHKNATVYLEIPLQETTDDPIIDDNMREPLIDQESSEICIGVDNQLINQSNFPKAYPSEKTVLEATISKKNKPVVTNLPGEFSGKQNSETNFTSQICNKYDMPEYFNHEIIMQELKNIECTKMTNEEALSHKNMVRMENEDSEHKLQQSVENSQKTQEHHSRSTAAHHPITNDEIVDALNKIFKEKSDNSYADKSDVLLTCGHMKTSINRQHNCCNDSNQNESIDENIKSIESLTMFEEVYIDYNVTKIEKTNEDHIAHQPKTTDEIVTALKKMFGESDDSMDMSEVVETENLEYDLPGKIPIVPNQKDLAVKASNEHHADEINMSLRNGLSLMEEPECDTVVEGIVDMLSDEIIGDITVVTLNCNECDVRNVDKDNIIEENIVANHDTLNNANCDSSDENVRNSLNNCMEPNGQEETKAPVIGTCCVFSVIKEVVEINENGSEIKVPKENIDHELNKKEIDDMRLIIPQNSYSYMKNSDETIRRSSRNMKRKKDMSDIKTVERKYRKGKNIDYPKTTALAIADLAYAKEYKRLIDYCSTIKFSYARPFHIECIDVDNMLKAWPITECSAVEINDSNNAQDLLYRDTEDTENANVITDPLKQTLNEEIVNGENINNYESSDINEINFNMGFGERSGRVIQKIETGITKLSAATLSDVKQYQPFSMSEVNESYFDRDIDTQKVKLSDFTSIINMKEKVRSFFKKTEVELASELLRNKKYTASDHLLSKFPFCLTSTEFLEFPRMESVVNVVQVGQLPVNAALQNSVTCDPRVTHVSDASPQCSDNSTGDDTHSTVETEYTELTTATITLPLRHEYAHHNQQSPPSKEQNSSETNDSIENESSFSIVKIELIEETSQENFENDIYDNNFSPLPNINGEYSFEDTSNTLFNRSVNSHHTTKTDNTSNNMFNTTSTIDTTMYDHTTNMDSGYSIDNTPSSTDSTYTNMDNASSSMYSTSPNMGNSSTEIDDTVNINEASNMDTTTDMDDASANNTYSSMYNPMDSDSSDVNNTVSNNNGSPIELENRSTNMDSTSNIENATYDYTYENIEDYTANIENNNNDNYAADVDNFDAVENYSANVDDYGSNVESYAPNDESYRADVEKYASSIENFATQIENYSTNIENYKNNADNTDTHIDSNLTNNLNSTANILEEPQDLSMANSSLETKSCNTFEDGVTSKINQIEHALDAAGIAAESVITSGADELANLITQSVHATSDNYSKSTPINVMTLQQALAHVLPPPLNQTGTSDNSAPNDEVPQQVVHIVQGNNAQTVINKPNGTHLLHIVKNKNNPANTGLSLIDAGLQQGGNQLIHIVNNGNQNNAQFLKRVNLLTNLTNAQGSNEQKMIQFVCKSADGKSIQLNTGHQRSMVLRLHPTTTQAAPKPTEPQDLSTASSSGANSANGKNPSQDIKSRSVYEENYAQFIQNSGSTPGPSSTTPCQEKATSLPKFNQVFGKQSYQENQNEINNGLQENSDCSPKENNSHLEQAPELNSPPLGSRNAPAEATQAQPSPSQQIKQTSPVNIHTTMHGGVIYTRQIPVNIGGRQTINLITVPTTELDEESPEKQQSDSHLVSQEGGQSSIIKLVPNQTSNNNVPQEEKITQPSTSNETNHNPQPVLTQMRIKLPMLSKGHHIVPGARLVRPSFFQIQRNVIAGTNQPVYQQLVLTTAPPLQQTNRLPTQSSQVPPLLVQTSQHSQSSPHIPVQQVQHAPSSQHVTVQQTHSAARTPQSHSVPPELTKPDAVPESELSTLTLEQLREFDMVLEQVKERSVHPTPSTTPSANPCTPADSTDGPALATTTVSESTEQVLYSVENSQPTNVVSYVNRKSTITSAMTSFVRSPDSSGIVDSPSSSTQVQITRTVTSKSSTSDAGSAVASQPKKKKKKKPPSSSSTMASLGSPSKTNSLKPHEDEQTTQRILYILAEYKEQVENSPHKNKPAPRRRNQFAPTIGTKRKRHCSSRGTCRRDGASPTNGESGEHGDDLITLGSEDSSCGTTFSECMDCQEMLSPDSPTKVVRKLTIEQETAQITQTKSSQLPQRNVIVGDRQTITVARTSAGTTAKPTTTVLMPTNYILPVSMLKGGQQIAIMTNRGPKILVGAGGDNNTSALLIQRLITPGLTRPGIRHIRLPTTLHNLQAFNIQTTPVTQVQPPDSTAPQTPMPGPPDLIDLRTPWQDREAQDKPTRGPSPDCTEPWNLPSSSIADDYGYEEIVRTDNMERTVLDAIPDRYSPDMEAQRIFDKMFDVDSKKSMYDSSRCGYDIDTSDGDDRPYPQVVQQRKDGRYHRVTHVSTAALRHKYAILEHELRLQKSLSEECEDLGVDSPSASELFPEADILFGAPSPAHEQTIDHCSTPPPIPMPPQPELDDQIAADNPVVPTPRNDDLDLNLDDVEEIVTVGEDGIATIPIINPEEFAKNHPNTTFHTEPEDGEIAPFTIAQSIKGQHITYHANRVPGTVVMPPQTTVISQATVNSNDHNTVKFIDIDNMINSMPCPQPVVQSVLVKDTGNTRPQSKFDSLKETGSSSHKSSSKSDSLKNSGKSASRTSSKFDSSKDTFAPRSKFDNLKEPNTSQRSSSKFDSLKDSASFAHKSSSKFDSLREPGVSTSRSGSKFNSLKDGISNSRSSSKYDKEATGSRLYSKFDSLKDTGNLAPKPLSKFDALLTESKLQLSSKTSARQAVHSTGHGTQVIRRLRYDERTKTKANTRSRFEEPRRRTSISDEVKMRNDRAMVESMGDNASSPGQPELFWDSTTADRHEKRFQFNESEKVTKSPFDELLNDSSAYGPHTRLDSVIKAARPERTYERTSFEGISGSTDESRPLRTYPPKRVQTQPTQDTESHLTLKTTTTTTHNHEVNRATTKTTHHHEVDRTKKTKCQESEGRRRTGRGLVKRGCSCCNGSQSAPPKKRSRPKKPPPEFSPSNKTDLLTKIDNVLD